MPTNTETDTATRETAQRARAQATRSEAELDAAEHITAFALRELVSAWTDAARLFIPPVVLRPEEAIRIISGAVAQAVELQRRFAAELLSVGHDAVVATDLEPLSTRRNGDGITAKV